MVAANTEISPRETALARAFARLVERRWMLVAALAVLSGFAVAGVLGPWTAGALLLLFALAVAFLQPAETRSSLPGGVLLAPASGMAPAAPPAEQSAAFEAFADALPDPCFILDRRGVVRYANQRANAAFAIRAGEALTFRIRVPDLVQAFDVVAKGGPPQRVEFTERVPNERWLAAWIARLGASDAVLLLIADMTEQHKTDRVRVDFVANASHELRTPLASLAGFIETLEGPAREDAAARTRFLAIMREQAGRMSRLVNDLLSLSRIEMKAHVRPADSVDLVAVVSHVVDSLEPQARDLGVAIEMGLPAVPVAVTGDRDELIQVFENLIENACKYGQSGRHVTVTVTAAGDGQGPRVAIRDFGPGIPAEHIPRLTERFYRVDVEDSRRHRGTGLGLAIVKHIVARHLARLTITSRVGEGATFTVNFPAGHFRRSPGAEENAETFQ
jgi:two-component system phosphate regulon sensor histidine kinase PhoR